MAHDRTLIGIAQDTQTGDYSVVLKATSEDKCILRSYFDVAEARSLTAGLIETCDEIDQRKAEAARATAQAITTMKEGAQ